MCLCGKCYVLCICAVESVMFCVFVRWKGLCSVCFCGGKVCALCVCVESVMFCVFLWKVLCFVCLCGKCYVLCVCVVESVMFRVPRSSRSLAPVLGDTKQSKWGQETAVHWRLSLICCQSSPGLAVSNMPTPWRLASTIRRLKWQWVERWHVRWMLFGILTDFFRVSWPLTWSLYVPFIPMSHKTLATFWQYFANKSGKGSVCLQCGAV